MSVFQFLRFIQEYCFIDHEQNRLKSTLQYPLSIPAPRLSISLGNKIALSVIRSNIILIPCIHRK